MGKIWDDMGCLCARVTRVRGLDADPDAKRPATRCTHLICAVPGAPKHRRAHKDGGVVVSPKWLQSCQDAAAKAPAKPFLVPLP